MMKIIATKHVLHASGKTAIEILLTRQMQKVHVETASLDSVNSSRIQMLQMKLDFAKQKMHLKKGLLEVVIIIAETAHIKEM